MLSFREVLPSDAALIHNWRTKNRVSSSMNTDLDSSIWEQEQWVNLKRQDPSYYHWIIRCTGKDIGLVSISNVDTDRRITSWGFYIGEDDFLGVGGFVPLYLYSYIFHSIKLEKVVAEVLYYNTEVIKLHLKHAYIFRPEKDYVIQKRKQQVLVISMELDKKDFVDSRYDKLSVELPVKHWEANPFGQKNGK